MLDALIGGPAAFVFGNNDFDHDDFQQHAAAIGVVCLDAFGKVAFDGKRIAVTHGDDRRLTARATEADAACHYLFTGHTHVQSDRRIGAVRWINPGALYRANRKSVALLDLATDSLTFLVVAD